MISDKFRDEATSQFEGTWVHINDKLESMLDRLEYPQLPQLGESHCSCSTLYTL